MIIRSSLRSIRYADKSEYTTVLLNTMSTSEVTIMSLPDELLRYIAEVYIKDELESMSWPCLHYTCKRFKKLADPVNKLGSIYFPNLDPHISPIRDDDFCRKIPTRYKPKILKVSSYVVDLSIYNRIGNLTIYRDEKIEDECPDIIWSTCSAIDVSIYNYQQHIRFDYFTNILSLSLHNTARSYCYDLRTLTQLSHLSIEYSYFNTFLIPDSVNYVTLDYCYNINFSAFANIDTLRIFECCGVNYSEIDNNLKLSIHKCYHNFTWPKFKRIEDLQLSYLDHTITYIPYIETLKKITMWNSHISDISSISHLEYIDIRGSRQLYTLPYMPNAEYVRFDRCPAVLGKSVADIKELCPKLKKFIT
jgi:hypothetical protein